MLWRLKFHYKTVISFCRLWNKINFHQKVFCIFWKAVLWIYEKIFWRFKYIKTWKKQNVRSCLKYSHYTKEFVKKLYTSNCVSSFPSFSNLKCVIPLLWETLLFIWTRHSIRLKVFMFLTYFHDSERVLRSSSIFSTLIGFSLVTKWELYTIEIHLRAFSSFFLRLLLLLPISYFEGSYRNPGTYFEYETYQ